MGPPFIYILLVSLLHSFSRHLAGMSGSRLGRFSVADVPSVAELILSLKTVLHECHAEELI